MYISGNLTSDCSICIIGAGIIGLLWAAVLHYRGYRDITIVDKEPARRETARRLDLGYKYVQCIIMDQMYSCSLFFKRGLFNGH